MELQRPEHDMRKVDPLWREDALLEGEQACPPPKRIRDMEEQNADGDLHF